MKKKKSLASRIKKLERSGVTYYRCNYTKDGKRKVKESRSYSVIKGFLEDYDQALHQMRSIAHYNPLEVATWSKLSERALEAGTTLEDCVTYYLAKLKEATGVRSIKLYDAIDEYLSEKSHEWELVTLKDSSRKLQKYKDFQKNVLLDAITPIAFFTHLEKQSLSTTYRDNLRRSVSAFLNWCSKIKLDSSNEKITYRYLETNPLQSFKINTKGVSSKKICLLSPLKVRQVLEACVSKYNHRVCPQIILSLFAGVRPMEFRKKVKYDDGSHRTHALTWDAVLNSSDIVISEELSKTCSRSIPKSDCLELWLEWLALKRNEEIQKLSAWRDEKLGKTSKHDFWLNEYNKKLKMLDYITHSKHKFHRADWLSDNPKVKKILHGKVDVLRHTYASYTLALPQTTYGLLAKWMGNSEDICKKHYVSGAIASNIAEQVFDLSPQMLGKTHKILLA